MQRQYGSEIAGLQAEIGRIHDAYKAEIAARNSELARVHAAYKAESAALDAELARVHGAYKAEIEWYRSRLMWLIRIYHWLKPGIAWVQTFGRKLRRLAGSAR